MSAREPARGVDLPFETRRALVFVELYRRRFGVGPSWAELGHHMGWPKSETNARVRALRAAGLRWRRDEAGSLRVEPKAIKAILMLRAPNELRRER